MERQNWYDCYDIVENLKSELGRPSRRTIGGFELFHVEEANGQILEECRDQILSNSKAALLWERIRHNEEMEHLAARRAEEARKAAAAERTKAVAQVAGAGALIYGARQLRKSNENS